MSGSKTWLMPAALLAFVVVLATAQHVLQPADAPVPDPPTEPTQSAETPESVESEQGASDEGGGVAPDQPDTGERSASEPALGDPPVPREMSSGKATLYSRSKFGSYERATFSFEHGMRDDPTGQVVRNDWDVLYGNAPWGDGLSVQMVTDDRSVILDLGRQQLSNVLKLSFPQYRFPGLDRSWAVKGHVFAVHTSDGNSDLHALFRVDELVTGDHIDISWVSWDATGTARPSSVKFSGSEIRSLSAMFRNATRGSDGRAIGGTGRRGPSQRGSKQPGGTLGSPTTAILELRSGAGGGNPSRVTLAGKDTDYVSSMSASPLAFDTPVSIRERCVGFVSAPPIPKGKVFVITKVTYTGTAAGDSNGHGEFALKLGRTIIKRVLDSPQKISGTWTGRHEVLPGQERSVSLEIANSSTGRAVIVGHFKSAR